MKARVAEIFNNGTLAGTLAKTSIGFEFRYADAYFSNSNCGALSLSFPKRQQEYRSATLFPFFYGLLAEGTNKQVQCRLLHIDESDSFSLLLATATIDTIGSVTVKEIVL